MVEADDGVVAGPVEMGTTSSSEVIRGPIGDLAQAGTAGNTRFDVEGDIPVAFPKLDVKLTHKGGTLRVEGEFKSVLPAEMPDGTIIVIKGWFSNGTNRSTRSRPTSPRTATAATAWSVSPAVLVATSLATRPTTAPWSRWAQPLPRQGQRRRQRRGAVATLGPSDS